MSGKPTDRMALAELLDALAALEKASGEDDELAAASERLADAKKAARAALSASPSPAAPESKALVDEALQALHALQVPFEPGSLGHIACERIRRALVSLQRGSA
jgi:hypothetical protein